MTKNTHTTTHIAALNKATSSIIHPRFSRWITAILMATMAVPMSTSFATANTVSRPPAVEKLVGSMLTTVMIISQTARRLRNLQSLDVWAESNLLYPCSFYRQYCDPNAGSKGEFSYWYPRIEPKIIFGTDCWHTFGKQTNECIKVYFSALQTVLPKIINIWSASDIGRTTARCLELVNQTIAAIEECQKKYPLYNQKSRNDMMQNPEYRQMSQHLLDVGGSVVDITNKEFIEELQYTNKTGIPDNISFKKSNLDDLIVNPLRALEEGFSRFVKVQSTFVVFIWHAFLFQPIVDGQKLSLLNNKTVLNWTPDLLAYFKRIKKDLETMIKNFNFLQPLIVKHCQALLQLKAETGTPPATGA